MMIAAAGMNEVLGNNASQTCKLPSAICPKQCCKQRCSGRVGCGVISQKSKIQELEAMLAHPDAVRRREEAKQRQEVMKAQQLERLTTDWWMSECGGNLMVANDPSEFRDCLQDCQMQGKLIVVKFFAPFCHACKSMNPKILQIAKQNNDVAFIKFNAGSDNMRAQAEEFGVNRLPYFHIYLGPVLVAAFTANLITVAKLRRAIQQFKQKPSDKLQQQCYNNIVPYPESIKVERRL